jgi:hypothetical protein
MFDITGPGHGDNTMHKWRSTPGLGFTLETLSPCGRKVLPFRRCRMVDANRQQLVRHIATVHRSAYRNRASLLLGTVQGSAIRNYGGNRRGFGEVFSFPGASKLRDARFATIRGVRWLVRFGAVRRGDFGEAISVMRIRRSNEKLQVSRG